VGSTCAEENGAGMSPEEREILQRLSSKAQRFMSKEGRAPLDNKDDDVLHTDVYAANLTLLKH
jgi:hypothetical protein